MKPQSVKFILFPVVILLVIFLSGCKDKVIEKRVYTANVPVYMSYSDLRSAEIQSVEPVAMMNTGKIYFYNNYIFINEVLEGIHIIDNSDPTNPQNIGFIDIPGNIDMSTSGTYLYADSYVDLVVLNISDLNNVTEVTRINNVFSYTFPEYDQNYPIGPVDMNQGVVTGWTISEVEEINEIDSRDGGWIYFGENEGVDMLNAESGGSGGKASTIAIAGSMARFATHEGSLYTVNTSQVEVFDIANPASPVHTSATITTSRTIETLFTYNDYLFMGTTTGMLVYDVSNSGNPAYVSEIDHFQSCDPVVVDGTTAYVTLRAGNTCGGVTNSLEVININNISSPYVMNTYSMSGPYGLGIDGKTLFVCDGTAGLKIYDVTDPMNVDDHLISSFPGINAFDVIPYNDILILISEEGLYQYDYSDLENIEEISFLPFIIAMAN
ncbi:MAG: hypothetical protein A2W91_13730 [Bacteroidetes bacterium GWF2_38_335]|nr:MAG: hypothetical protein A2W91_13730 [Bacteroidetes bacterium GWF2_38_335]OFY77777.1 MAG: hypothetical protein A2281_15420 [Bacteroidetes bacterium RIFOXYA12_FULL_38_20]HBS87419.1 hypothetical protein [Bacteroidales bacterium]